MTGVHRSTDRILVANYAAKEVWTVQVVELGEQIVRKLGTN